MISGPPDNRSLGGGGLARSGAGMSLRFGVSAGAPPAVPVPGPPPLPPWPATSPPAEEPGACGLPVPLPGVVSGACLRSGGSPTRTSTVATPPQLVLQRAVDPAVPRTETCACMSPEIVYACVTCAPLALVPSPKSHR